MRWDTARPAMLALHRLIAPPARRGARAIICCCISLGPNITPTKKFNGCQADPSPPFLATTLDVVLARQNQHLPKKSGPTPSATRKYLTTHSFAIHSYNIYNYRALNAASCWASRSLSSFEASFTCCRCGGALPAGTAAIFVANSTPTSSKSC